MRSETGFDVGTPFLDPAAQSSVLQSVPRNTYFLYV